MITLGTPVHLYTDAAYNARGIVTAVRGAMVTVSLYRGGSVTCPACDAEPIRDAAGESAGTTGESAAVGLGAPAAAKC